jgi:hypothetical protein
MYRLLMLFAVALWMGAMSALFMRDVLPAWTAQDPPPLTSAQFAKFDRLQQQFSISGPQKERLGTAWGSVVFAGGNTTVQGTIVLVGLPIVPAIRVETITEFDAEGGLDSFTLDVFGVPLTKINARGERRGLYFPCELQMGPLYRQANLDVSACRMIGDSLRPFTFLPSLHVGQSWRMQVLDPLSAAMSRQAEFTSIVATVTGKERLDTLSGPADCMVVETSPQHAKAWVDPLGNVVMQQVDVPGIGKVTIREEKFEDMARTTVRQQIRSHPPWSNSKD